MPVVRMSPPSTRHIIRRSRTCLVRVQLVCAVVTVNFHVASSVLRMQPVMPWLHYDSTGVRRAFDCPSRSLSAHDVTRAAYPPAAVTLTCLLCPAPNRLSIKRCFRLTSVCLSVCLSVAYSGPKSRIERPRKTKIGTEIAHVTRSKGQRSRSPGRFSLRGLNASGGYSGGRGNVLAVGNCCYVAVCSAAQGASAPTGEERAGHIVASACLQLVIFKPRKVCFRGRKINE